MKTSTQRIKELESKIGELRDSIGDLETQLIAEKDSAQHEAIDRLENYINAVDTRFSSLREFWCVLVSEYRK